MSKRKEIDWAGCEGEYRAGVLSIRALAAKYGCAESAIRDRAKRYGWKRDLLSEVRAETNDRLLRSELRKPNAGEANDSEVVGNAADLRVAVVTSHRKDIAQLHGLKRVLADRLSVVLHGGEPDGPVLGERESPGDLLEKLSRITARLVPLERQAHSLDEDRGPDGATVNVTSVERVIVRPKAQHPDS